MNDPALLGNVMRGLVALALLFVLAGAAARVCRTRIAWGVAAVVYGVAFAWLMLGVIPHPHRLGLLYALQWGLFGAGVYAAGRMWSSPANPGHPADPESLLEFWFADGLSSPEAAEARTAVWFGSDPAFDDEIHRRFGRLPERALAGELDDWTESARGTLALVMVLDQLPRNLHRGEAQAFAYDERAREIALAAIDRGVDHELHPVEASFLYLPLEHAEDRAMQGRCVEPFGSLCDRSPPELAGCIQSYREYAERHRDVIERFGRFPHRNRVLDRAPTDEEKAWLEAGGDSFGG